MSLKELEDLQRRRQRELELLQSCVMTLGDALESGPRQWVEKHPYVATGTAAAVGFLAAQLTGTFFRKDATACSPMPAAAPATGPAASPQASSVNSPAPSAPSHLAQLLAVAVAIAEQLVQSHPESRPATFRVANGGAVVGAAFPEFFGANTSPASS